MANYQTVKVETRIPCGKYCGVRGNKLSTCSWLRIAGLWRPVCKLGLGNIRRGETGLLKPKKCLDLKRIDYTAEEV